VDLLKMDIEGAEYPVIADIGEDDVEVEQILIEFHHRFDGVGVAATSGAIATLNRNGYRIIAVAPGGAEYTFLKA
jgi:hypothetical protein